MPVRRERWHRVANQARVLQVWELEDKLAKLKETDA